jgi:endonuclease YncB( thermonuclease family)
MLATIAAGLIFTCTPTAVYDGDGPVWCREGPKIRISGIAAREADGTCRPGHPCPEASATDARNALVNLMGGAKGSLSTGHVRVSAPAMRCRSDGSAGGKRTAAWCVTASGVDLSCAMVSTGTVLKWDRYWRGHRC